MRKPCSSNPTYFVSDDGRVWGPRRELKPSPRSNARSYLCVTFTNPRKTMAVHQLVAEAFIGPRPDGFQTAHLDGNPLNNAVENLAYVTCAENCAHKQAHGTQPRGEKHNQHRLKDGDVRTILASSDSSASLARKYGMGATTIRHIRNGRNWRHISQEERIP